jgi:hypothetical protein
VCNTEILLPPDPESGIVFSTHHKPEANKFLTEGDTTFGLVFGAGRDYLYATGREMYGPSAGEIISVSHHNSFLYGSYPGIVRYWNETENEEAKYDGMKIFGRYGLVAESEELDPDDGIPNTQLFFLNQSAYGKAVYSTNAVSTLVPRIESNCELPTNALKDGYINGWVGGV